MHTYGSEFYNMISEIVPDEKQVVPYVLERIKPSSVIDFGCGEGRWLMEAKRNCGEIEVLGLDGHYVSRDRLLIAQDEFMEADLRKRIELAKRYDLAISTEVAEHIEEEYADIFVDNLVRASDCILFSAAVPGQGGEHHVNEQWQSYWVEKFKSRGYRADFSIRNRFWNEDGMNSWRRQNLLMFLRDCKEVTDSVASDLIDVVHPGMLRHYMDECQREMGALAECMLGHPEVPEAIRRKLEPLIERKRRIIIYPYGRNGRLCEMMLTYLFHYDRFLIVDNRKGGRRGKVLTFDAIDSSCRDAVVLDVCSNQGIHQELLDEIRGYVAQLERVTVFEA